MLNWITMVPLAIGLCFTCKLIALHVLLININQTTYLYYRYKMMGANTKSKVMKQVRPAPSEPTSD